LEFQTDCRRYPTNDEGLHALLVCPADLQEKWEGPYVKGKDIIDPWDNELIYEYPGTMNVDFDIYTLGADGREGGENENEDLGNW